MKFKFISIIFLLLFFQSIVIAETGASWLEISPGGRAGGLAETMTASSQGATSTYWNPAAVGMDGNSVEMMNNDWWVENSSSQHIAGSFALGKYGLGASIHHVGINDMELRTRPSDTPEGLFDSRNYSIGLSLSRLFSGGLRGGLSVRYLSESISYSHANGWSMDMGVLYPGFMSRKLDLGFTVRHLGHMDALNSEEYDLPTTFSIGALYHLGLFEKFAPKIMMDVAKVDSYDPSLHLGTELDFTSFLSLRCGYMTGYEAQGFAAGFGLKYDRWRFDYGYTPLNNDLGHAQRFSVSAVW
jgi:hypothetical protein